MNNYLVTFTKHQDETRLVEANSLEEAIKAGPDAGKLVNTDDPVYEIHYVGDPETGDVLYDADEDEEDDEDFDEDEDDDEWDDWGDEDEEDEGDEWDEEDDEDEV